MSTQAPGQAPSQSELMTRVGPGTAMGDLMRRYWLPALASGELKADGDPVRLMLLGEKLVAFRDSAGRVGVMDHRCPHRCASLFFGRNEEGGMRCVYHGWKFDVEGNCLDLPNVSNGEEIRGKVKAKAYKAMERAGLVWVYMGPQDQVPPPPALEAALIPPEEVSVRFVQRACNWLQALEGDIDTSHFGFLHAGHAHPDDFQDDHPMRHTVTNRAPEYHVAETPWGTSYGAYRSEADGRTSWRIANFMFPFWTQAPNADFLTHVGVRGWVPMDDEHTMVVMIGWKKSPPVYSGMPLKNGQPLPGFAPAVDYLPNTTDWYGRWRPVARAENDYQIDRDAQRRNEIYTGIRMVFLQDQAITESMGPITDHSFEHLVASDQMVARTRRRVLKAALALRQEGTLPPGVADPEVMWGARSGSFHTPAGVDWQQAYREKLQAAMRVPRR
ncbi:MAG TPA: Rieske 2Fe-2S domain-containing protein [Ramlibacter sp.]|uniref:Rieske 2Fe-2S domain-containing protein n=1 Tax=Ramlibacter sp. TaxID=1917967 RepID=UPI002D7ECFE8|nr:Rieske 2Fe-2S domain-containing protein [Ramlibacter sp.]HET8746783.1 Rieske 2Fe-2S domain-containing protein [Ramlibacter sp.]